MEQKKREEVLFGPYEGAGRIYRAVCGQEEIQPGRGGIEEVWSCC